MLLSQLLDGVDVEWQKEQDTEISGVAYNSRLVTEGGVFVCIKGYQTDGHRYIADALRRGAAVIVLEDDVETGSAIRVRAADTRKALAKIGANWFGNPAAEAKIIGVTGTNGKTTVTTLIKHILEFQGKKVGLIGTNANMIGDTVLPTERTTPESFELQGLFRQMVDSGVEYIVMEVSSHSLYLSRVYGIEFTLGVFTNLTQDHLDFHITMENYLSAKEMLFSVSRKGIINADDDGGKAILKKALCPMVSYSVDSESDYRAESVRVSARGVLFDLCHEGESYATRLAIPGKFSVYNALAACSACFELGFDAEQITGALMVAQGVKGRAETVYTNTDYTVIIDYAHTPDGLENIISTVRDFSAGRVITVFGCGGDRDATKRPIMGEIAGRLSDFCVITSDNPRTENPFAILREIEKGMKKTVCPYTTIENRREAIRYALTHAQKDDCIILAGKGHETYQIIGTEKRHFDEREVIKEILGGKKEV